MVPSQCGHVSSVESGVVTANCSQRGPGGPGREVQFHGRDLALAEQRGFPGYSAPDAWLGRSVAFLWTKVLARLVLEEQNTFAECLFGRASDSHLYERSCRRSKLRVFRRTGGAFAGWAVIQSELDVCDLNRRGKGAAEKSQNVLRVTEAANRFLAVFKRRLRRSGGLQAAANRGPNG
jgi:hypothetical protein